jgi:hypothetical protein
MAGGKRVSPFEMRVNQTIPSCGTNESTVCLFAGTSTSKRLKARFYDGARMNLLAQPGKFLQSDCIETIQYGHGDALHAALNTTDAETNEIS